MFVLSFESLQQLDYLLNYTGCQQTAICNEGMFSHIMTTDSWCQTGYAFQFAAGNNNNYSSCKSSLHYSMGSFCRAHHASQADNRERKWQTSQWLTLTSVMAADSKKKKEKRWIWKTWENYGFQLFSDTDSQVRITAESTMAAF